VTDICTYEGGNEHINDCETTFSDKMEYAVPNGTQGTDDQPSSGRRLQEMKINE